MNLDFYKQQFDSLIAGISDEHDSLLNDRKRAFKYFTDNGFPQRNEEAWQFTDLKSIETETLALLKTEDKKLSDAHLANLKISDSNTIALVNGELDTELSNYPVENIDVKPISERNPLDKEKLNSPFVALNTSFRQGGYIINIKDKYDSKRPIHIINYVDGENGKVQFNQYNSIALDKNSSATIIEETIVQNNDIFLNNLTEIEINENANFEHMVLQNNDSKTLAINHYFIKQNDDSNYNAQFITKNGALIRNEVSINISGQNCNTNVYGLGLLERKDHIENYTNVIHQKPHCNSHQLYKYLLKDSSEGVFNGLVKVQKGAQQTESQQTNRNILLSKKALMNSNPQLEIYADDVKCGHGSATGELDDDAIFYLRCRGLDIDTAKSLLIEGFLNEIIDQIKNKDFRERVNTVLQNWLIK